MPVSLYHFHFSAEKSAQIFAQYRKECDMSYGALERRTGIPRDTLGNIFSGKVRDIKLETAFKLCVAFGVPFMVYLQLMLNDEGIDFMDEVLLYDPRQDKVIPVGDHDVTSSAVVPDSVAAVAVAAPDVTVLQHHDPSNYTRADFDLMIRWVEGMYEQHIADLRDQIAQQQAVIRALIEKR